MTGPDAGSAVHDSFGVELARVGDVCVVALLGEHDLTTIDSVRAAVAQARPQGLPLVLDLCGAAFIDSSVLNLVVQLSREAQQPGQAGFAVAARPGSHPARLFDLGGLRALLPVYDDVEQAAAALRPHP